MPYPEYVARFNINATNGAEQMVNTVWMRPDNLVFAPSPQVLLQAMTNKVRDSWATLITTGFSTRGAEAGIFHSNVQWNSVTGYFVDPNGKATVQTEAAFAAAVKGSNASAIPPQCSIVVTTLTGAPGRSARGRLYLGMLSTTVLASDGRVQTTIRDRLAANMADFYKACRDIASADDKFRPVVVSPTTNQARKITAVQVGNTIDTMRSRRNKLVEARIRASVDE